jgi:hypothetical protein
MRRNLVCVLPVLLLACAPVSVAQRAVPDAADPSEAAALVPRDDAAADAATPDRQQKEPDGNDDGEDADAGQAIPLGATLHLERVGRSWGSLTRICDLTAFQGALYGAHAVAPLGVDGATITRYERATDKLTVAFDWNRPGEPAEGGGGGQGFVRVHAIGGRLYVPDADPPYDGFGIVDPGTEGYVFVSDEQGSFARATNPPRPGDDRPKKRHFRPPSTALLVPRAYHDIDVVRFQGKIWVSTGSVPPRERAWHGSSPGALSVLDEATGRFAYVAGYPPDATRDVWRLTYMVRFRDLLYAGIQEYEPREVNDYVVFDGSTLTGKRVTTEGGAQTLRWYADRGSLYWIAIDKDGTGQLRVTHDGVVWETVELPEGVGRPADIVRFRGELVVLTENALLSLGSGSESIRTLATWNDKKLFAVTDIYCAAPLAVYQGELYAGSQKDGALYRFE